jgi:hypothetical protein
VWRRSVAWQRVEAPRDRGELVDRNLGIAPDRHVVGHGGRRQQRYVLLGLKVLARQTLRAAVPLHSVLVEAPAAGARTRVVDRAKSLAPEAVVAHRWHGPLDPRLVLRVAHAGGVDHEAARLRVLEETVGDPRRDRIGLRDDRLGVVGDHHAEHAPEEFPGSVARLDRRRGRLLEHRVDEAVARADRGEDPRA